MSNKILVLGSEGFVGLYLKEHFKSNENVFFSDYIQKGEDRYIQCDITDPAETLALVKQVLPDSVIYLTSQSSVKRSFDFPQETFKINIEGLLNTLTSFREVDIQPYFIYISTIEVYKKGNSKINERHTYECDNPYSISKAAGEDIITLYKKLGFIKGIIVQPVSHIGPGQSPQFSISSFAKQIAELDKKGGTELLVGNLDVFRDVLDVRDVVEFYLQLLETLPTDFEKVIVSSGNGYNFKDIVDRLIELSGNDSIKVKVDKKRLRPIDNPYIVASPSYALSKFHWRNKIPMDKTLKDILDYWRSKI
ncbi:GDP-mannose 4,6-dehydratase [bacterium]|nr:GDP-mannose 4,6-dehydratase [bacterium]